MDQEKIVPRQSERLKRKREAQAADTAAGVQQPAELGEGSTERLSGVRTPARRRDAVGKRQARPLWPGTPGTACEKLGDWSKNLGAIKQWRRVAANGELVAIANPYAPKKQRDEKKAS